MHRRRFLESSALAALSAVFTPVTSLAYGSSAVAPFQWKTDDLTLSFEVIAGKLRQKQLVPADIMAGGKSSSVEVALQCSGENSPDQGMKSCIWQPGMRLLFGVKREQSALGSKCLVSIHA